MKHFNLLKTTLLLCALIVGSLSGWAADETIDFTAQGFTNQQAIESVSGTNCTITFNKGTNSNPPKYYTTGTAIRAYGGNTMTVASTTKIITKIEITFGTSDGSNDITTDVNTYSNGVWTGSSESVKFTIGGSTGNRRIASIAVTYQADNRTDVNLTSFIAAKTTLVVGDEVTTSISNDQEGWTASYTYSSDDIGVATVDSNGKITAVAKGTTTIHASLNIENDDAQYKKGSTYMRSIEITVCKPSHKVVFSINGVASIPVFVEEDEKITFPVAPATLGGKKFMGWKVDSGIEGTTDIAPTLKSEDIMPSADRVYYAVFATETTEAGEVSKVYGFETASDDDWIITGVARDNSNANSGSYAGKINSANTYVTFNEKVKVKEFSFAFKRTSNNSNYNVYIETSTDNSNWTAAETYSMNTFNNGSYLTKTKTFDGNTELYVRFHCHNTTAVRYVDDVTIVFDGETKSYSSYCTSLTEPISISAAGWATYSSNYPLDFTGVTALTAYTATKESSVVKFNKVTGKVPANTGLLVRGETANVPVCASAEAVSNLLVGVTTDTPMDAGTIFVLMKGSKGIGFYKNTNDFTLRANSAYLPAEAVPTADARAFIALDDETTGIADVRSLKDNTESMFDLQGRKIAKPTKGLYIVNGKKIVVK
jgi:hypothetical protein